MGYMEHRWGQRAELDIPVRITGRPNVMGAGRISNISTSGAWIRTALEPAELTPIQVLPQVGAAGRKPKPIPGFVARRGNGGIGVEWFEALPATAWHVFLSPSRSSDLVPVWRSGM